MSVIPGRRGLCGAPRRSERAVDAAATAALTGTAPRPAQPAARGAGA
ncbi:hypothetical protein OG935_07845 [Nocardia cyriacigeorgica]|nr:hypothetical protein [Nocardia cyriacigeorgica]MBF6496838.1 hypothetical protein [Nocardia cyriacigeorgica]